jgi:hypothetical protein
MKNFPQVLYVFLLMAIVLTACDSKSPEVTIQLTPTDVITSAQTTLLAQVTDTPVHSQPTTVSPPTSTPTQSPPTATGTPLPSPTKTAIPLELTGSHAMIEKTFVLQGFQFTSPQVNGDLIGNYGSLELKQANGDLFDMSIYIQTVSIGDALFRAQIGFVVPRMFTSGSMTYVQDLMYQFISVSEADWTAGPAWINTTLAQLESQPGQRARTSSGEVQVILDLAPAGEGIAYVLTISADPEDQP